MLNRDEAIRKINAFGKKGEPFVFLTDYLGERTYLEALERIDPGDLSFDFNGITNVASDSGDVHIDFDPVSREIFQDAFDRVVAEINYGNSFLANLTFETPIRLTASLDEVFRFSRAKYKIRFREDFICFSPESFVRISSNTVRSYPMKGTIRADEPDASVTILNDPKETAEHITIVDLIRNDLSSVATHVKVNKFRYLDNIKTSNGDLLQVSSEISGDLESGWREHLGDLIYALLPAGSITGAPKPKTVELLNEIETHNRGFYTGICGLFDGESLDSGVMIRFIEQRGRSHFYKSGGGITSFSQLEAEYSEYINKIYVPVY